jgi:hypothetical protein
MCLDELPSQREAETKCRFASSSARSVEAGKHLLLLFGLDPRPVVDHDYGRIFIVAAGFQPDMAAVVGISDCITKDMFDGLPKPPCIADDASGARFQGEF